MTYQHNSFKKPSYLTGVLAGEDLSAKQYYAVMYDVTDETKVKISDGTKLIGWLMNAPESGIQAEVATIGGGAVGIADGTITVGDDLTITSAGKVKLAVAGDPIVAVAMETVTDGDAVAILPMDLSELNPLAGLGDFNTGITALAGGGQTGATALIGDFNDITVCASDYDSVLLPAAAQGKLCTIKNSSANILSVFPALADSINAMAVNLSVDIPAGAEVSFKAISAIIWESKESDYISAATTQSGGFEWKATDNSGNYIVRFTNDAHGQNTVIHAPDSGLPNSYIVQSPAAVILTGTQTEMNRLDDSAEVESVVTAGAASVIKFNTNLNVASGGAVTLAACPASMVGKIKTIRMETDDGDVTISLANVQGGTAATTATFNDIGEELILIGSVGGKWTVVKEFGVTLS